MTSPLPDGWQLHRDKWNRVFYFNATTGVSRWQPPQGNQPYIPQIDIESLPPGWVGHRDSSSGKTYYVDTSSGISQWTFPKNIDTLPAPWQKHKDPISSRNYYYNPETKESRWTAPTPDVREKTPDKKQNSPEKTWIASKHSDSPSSPPSTTTISKLFGAVHEPVIDPVVRDNNASATSSSHITSNVDPSASIYNTTTVGIATASTTASTESKNEQGEQPTPLDVRPVSDLTARPVSDLTFLAPAEEELPAGWKSLVDPNSGKTYYYSTFTGKTQWSRPLAPAIPPPPAITPSSTPGLPQGTC